MTTTELEQRLGGRTPGLQGVKRHYAVLVPLVERQGTPHVLFEVRADTLGRQPGEVCFPGGKAEPGETWEACALRETWEELSIPAEAIRVLAALDCIYHQGSFLLHPILAQVDAAALSPSPAEVKEVFYVPLDFFLQTPPALYTYPLIPRVGDDFPYADIGFPDGYPWRGGKIEVPIYRYEGHAIWGLTGRILRWLAAQLAP